MAIIEDLFINVCIVTTLVFAYMKIRWGHADKNKNIRVSYLIDGLLGGILGLILMEFSIRVTDETIVDLRYIPILLMLLFVGKKPAFITTFLISLFRFFFGFNLSSYAAIFFNITIIIGFLIIDNFKKKEEDFLVKGMYMVIYSNIVIVFFLYYLIRDTSVIIPLSIIYFIVSTIGGFISIFLVKYLRTSEYLYKKYESESTIDFLTGLKNVRKFEDLWNYSIKMTKQKKIPLSLLMLDIDHFKNINDTYGHGNGDFVLMEISRIMEEATSEIGTVFRKGGEEFAIILPGVAKNQALDIAEKIRVTVERHQFIIDKNTRITVTISIGLISYPETTTELDLMVEDADAALYLAKDSGRNQVAF